MITGLWKLYLFSHPYLLKWVVSCIYILFSSSYFFLDLSPIIIYPFRNWLTHSLTAVPHSFITCFMAFLDILVQKNGC